MNDFSDLKEMALDLAVELFNADPEMKRHSEEGIRIAQAKMPWASMQEIHEILMYVAENFDALASSVQDGLDGSEALRRGSINTTAAAGLAMLKAEGRL
jgi:hypothetical protein